MVVLKARVSVTRLRFTVVKVAVVNDTVMPFSYTVYNSYERVHERLNSTIAIAEKHGQDFLIVDGDCSQVFHEEDRAAIGWEPLVPITSASQKKVKTG